jgi:predicted NACHT family NTPase
LEQVLGRSTKKHTHKDYRLLQSLLKNVKEIWIKDGLEACVFSKILMDLNISQKPNLIKKPFNESTLIIDRSRTNLKEENLTSGLLQRVVNHGKSILVTGEPGSGKTTTLLKLLEKLIEKTEQDLNNPIPIVFNLSSWSISKKSISDWLVQELHEKYRVSKSLGRNLVQSENLLLLLDGLDEILSKSERENCIHQINYFLRNYGQTQIVVCCRTKDYEELSTRLELQAAICINPLTYEQINQHLDKAGVELSGLKELLTQNASLMDLASTPLILSVMSLSYQNIGVGEIQIPSIDKYRQYLFDLYIDKMLERRALILKKVTVQ